MYKNIKYITIFCFSFLFSCVNNNSELKHRKELVASVQIDNYTICNILDSFLTLTPSILEIRRRCEGNVDTAYFSSIYSLPCGISKHSNQKNNCKFYFDEKNGTYALDLNFLPNVRTVLNLVDYKDNIYMFRGNSELLLFNSMDSIVLLFPSDILNYQTSSKTNSECFILDSELYPIASFASTRDTASNVGSVFLYYKKRKMETKKIEVNVPNFQKIKYKHVFYSDILKLCISIKSKNFISIDSTKVVSPYLNCDVPFWLRQNQGD